MTQYTTKIALTDDDKKTIILDSTKRSEFCNNVCSLMQSNIIGQDEPILNIIDSLSRLISGIKNKERPILSMLFLGPTGVGKTETVKVLAEALFGKRNAFARVNCQELSESHALAKLLGAPPGYVGADIEPLLSQDNLDRACKEARESLTGIFSSKYESLRFDRTEDISLILFDEVEKAHPKIHTALLGILDDGNLILSNNKRVSFRNSIIIMTSNVGSKEIDTSLKNEAVGFNICEPNVKNNIAMMKERAVEEAVEFFPPEFMNRFDNVVPFNTLSDADIKQILDIGINKIKNNLIECNASVGITLTKEVIEKIIKEGSSKRYGARQLNRSLEKLIVTPLARIIASEQVIPGDLLLIKDQKGEIVFERSPRTRHQIRHYEKSKNQKVMKKTAKCLKTEPVKVKNA